MQKDYEAAEAATGLRLREFHLKKGWTQTQLAVRAGTNQAVSQKIENSESLQPRCLPALAAVLEVNPAWLACGEPHAAPVLVDDVSG
jgi:transcriptional regulator with XRE-family HTH domain